jgi:hypothetical protein
MIISHKRRFVYIGPPRSPAGATELMEEHGPMGVQVPVEPTPGRLAEAVQAAIAPENRGLVRHAARVVAEHYTAEAMRWRWSDYLVDLL